MGPPERERLKRLPNEARLAALEARTGTPAAGPQALGLEDLHALAPLVDFGAQRAAIPA